VHRLIVRRSSLILWLAIVLTLVSGLLCLRLRLDLDLLALLPPRNPQVRTFLNVSEKIGLQSLLIAVVEPPARGTESDARALVDQLAEAFAADPLIRGVEFKREELDLEQFLPLLMQRLPHLLSPQALAELPARLTDAEIHDKVAQNRKLLSTPFGFAAQSMLLADPLGLGELLQSSLALPATSIVQKQQDGYFKTPNGQFLIFIKPDSPPQDIAFSKNLMRQINAIETRVRQDAATTLADLARDSVIRYTGGYPLAVNDEAVTKKDIQIAIVGSVFGVLALFGICFRSIKILGTVSVPLLMSIVWTLGLAGLLFGRLNLLTCIFSCVLAGLGIDFAIHMVNRFHSAEKQALSAGDRLELTFRETGSGIVVGALTTAAAFFAVGFSDFRGFRELGIMTGSGLLLCLAAMLFVLPALLVRSGGVQRPLAISGFGLVALLRAVGARPIKILLGLAVLALVLSTQDLRVRFDDNLKNFRAPDDETLQLQEHITQWLGGSSAASLLVLSDPSEEALMTQSAAVYESLSGRENQAQIADVTALARYFPSPERQRRNLAFVDEHAALFDWTRIRAAFDTALRANGLEKLPAYDAYFKTLQAAFEDRTALLPSDLAATPLAPLIDLFFFRADGRAHTVLYVRPTRDLWSQADVRQFKNALETLLKDSAIPPENAVLTGAQLLSAEVKSLILKNLRFSLILAITAIITLLMLYYRNLFLLAGALVPLVTTLAVLSGIMALLGIDYNFVNVIVLPMIVGIGIDDGVHLMNTFVQDGYRYHPESLARTGRGVVLTSLTTMVGFGSLSLSHYPGLRSMGYVAILGVSACLLTSLFVLPPLMVLMSRRKGQKPIKPAV
jgi:uncharacterized protein